MIRLNRRVATKLALVWLFASVLVTDVTLHVARLSRRVAAKVALVRFLPGMFRSDMVPQVVGAHRRIAALRTFEHPFIAVRGPQLGFRKCALPGVNHPLLLVDLDVLKQDISSTRVFSNQSRQNQSGCPTFLISSLSLKKGAKSCASSTHRRHRNRSSSTSSFRSFFPSSPADATISGCLRCFPKI